MNGSGTCTSYYFFLNKVQMEQAKMNLNLSLPVYSRISTLNVKDEYIINN